MASAVGVIVGKRGDMRVVVTEIWRFKYHLTPGERLFVLPKLRVKEPIPWGAIPNLIEHAHSYARKWL